MDWSQMTFVVGLVLALALLAEAATGWSDAPVGTAAAVASGVLKKKQALHFTVWCNFIGALCALIVGAKVAHTFGTTIVSPAFVTVETLGVALTTSILWSCLAIWLGLPLSKMHSLLAALAGVAVAKGGFAALATSNHWWQSGWGLIAIGMVMALVLSAALSWFLATLFRRLKWHTSWPYERWRKVQLGTVFVMATGHGFNDGLKYAGIFTLVMLKAGLIASFQVFPIVIVLCAIALAVGTYLGGSRIHHRLDSMVNKDSESHELFEPYMGVAAEGVAGLFMWGSGMLGIPMSTNHALVAAMAGAKSVAGRIHQNTAIKIVWGWVVTYFFCFSCSWLLATQLLS
jgi:PiT family inorganic phosphate transporter